MLAELAEASKRKEAEAAAEATWKATKKVGKQWAETQEEEGEGPAPKKQRSMEDVGVELALVDCQRCVTTFLRFLSSPNLCC